MIIFNVLLTNVTCLFTTDNPFFPTKKQILNSTWIGQINPATNSKNFFSKIKKDTFCLHLISPQELKTLKNITINYHTYNFSQTELNYLKLKLT